jgi:hypothetical protein
MTDESSEKKRYGDRKSREGSDSSGNPDVCKKDQWSSDRKKSQIDWRASRSDRKSQWKANRSLKKQEWQNRRAQKKTKWEGKC